MTIRVFLNLSRASWEAYFDEYDSNNNSKWHRFHCNMKYLPLCPILSTSLGLSISEQDDNVELSTVEEIFKHLEGTYVAVKKLRPRWV